MWESPFDLLNGELGQGGSRNHGRKSKSKKALLSGAGYRG
jgi:hypothetical protein